VLTALAELDVLAALAVALTLLLTATVGLRYIFLFLGAEGKSDLFWIPKAKGI